MQYDFEFRSRRSNVLSRQGMVASSQPLASLVGLDILRAGGNAADAAVAMAGVLNVVEPFSTGIGGDCFALYWDSGKKKVFALNGSGPAPQSANLDDLIQAGYEEYPLFSGHAVSVPGTVAGWCALLDRFGTISLSDALAPAIHYADNGFALTEWIGTGWKLMEQQLLRVVDDTDLPKHLQLYGPPQPSGEEFLINGLAPSIGELVVLPTLGETLRSLAAEGRGFFYEGTFAENLCAHVQRYGGWIEPNDLSGFQAEWVEPIHADYRDVRLYECPPNGQGLAAIIATKIAGSFDFSNLSYIDRIHILIEAMRLGFLDAFDWVSDPQFNELPLELLLSKKHIDHRCSMISMTQTNKQLQSRKIDYGDDTVYLSVVDGQGNACSFINSLYMGGGTGLVVPGTGVLLQNRAALFSLDPTHPNALQGGKRPYHTIIPAMLTKNDELYSSFGIMGGYMQPQAHLQILSNLVDCEHNPQQALDMPRFCLNVGAGKGIGSEDPGGEVLIEKGFTFDEIANLRNRGHRISPISGWQRSLFGGGQVILRDPENGVLIAGSDPRKDGCALGY